MVLRLVRTVNDCEPHKHTVVVAKTFEGGQYSEGDFLTPNLRSLHLVQGDATKSKLLLREPPVSMVLHAPSLLSQTLPSETAEAEPLLKHLRSTSSSTIEKHVVTAFDRYEVVLHDSSKVGPHSSYQITRRRILRSHAFCNILAYRGNVGAESNDDNAGLWDCGESLSRTSKQEDMLSVSPMMIR